MTRIVKLPAPQNVGSGQRATIRLPLGRTYNRIFLFGNGGTGITRALMSNIVLKVNTGEKMRWKSSAHIQARNDYRKGANDANILELDFMEREAKDEAAMTMGTYALTNEAGVQDAVLELDLGAYAGVGTLTAYAEIDVPSQNRLIVRTRYQQKTLAGAVEEPIVIPYGQNGEQLKRIFIFGDLTAIDSLRIRRDESDEFEALSVAQNEFIQKTYSKVPQAGLMVFDAVVHNLQSHMLNTAMILGAGGKVQPVQNMDVRLAVNKAATFDIYTESLTTNDKP